MQRWLILVDCRMCFEVAVLPAGEAVNTPDSFEAVTMFAEELVASPRLLAKAGL